MSETTAAPPTADAVLHHACSKAMDYHLDGQLEPARSLYAAILAARPDHATAAFAMAMLEVQVGQPAQAVPRLRALVQAHPGEAQYWSGLAEALAQTGARSEALRSLEHGRLHGLAGADVDGLAERLTSTLPRPELHARLLATLGSGTVELTEALASELIVRFPEDGLGWKVRGSLLWVRDRDPLAEHHLKKATRLLPEDPELWGNLAHVLGSAARWADAEPCYRKALALAQEDPTLHFRLGQTLFALGRLDDAEQSLRRSLTCQPDQVDPLCQLAEICLAGGRIDEALACYERILALPDLDARTVDNVGSSRLFALAHQPGLPPEQLFAEHLRYGAQLAQVVSNPCTTWSNRPDPHRVITIGMVSGDLYNHAVALFLAPILARLVADGRHRIEIYQTQSASDDVTARLRGYCHGWTMVQSMSDAELVAKIRADGVDILIDLAGHTGGHRLRAFAARPAPIQVSWLGYAGTTGLAAVDYYIGDEAYLPAGFESQFSEQLVRLPGTVPMPEVLDLPALSPLPALASGHFTFGSFNRGGKINGATLNLWAALLRAVPDSRILIGHIGGSSLAPKIRQALVDQGVAAARVEFVGRLGYTEYLRCHSRVDLCLDTFPYTGGTTTTSALLMGVPTLTIGGPTPISRQSTLRMAGAGLQAFVAEDAEDFVAQGVYWAQRPSELAALRAGMRERIAASPALQPDVIAASLSRALRTMWQRWCAGLPPAPIRT